MPRSVEFFEHQFQRQVQMCEFELNPFERLALDYLQGAVLDLGCGLGNLTLAAARRGCIVTAIDASPTAIARIRDAAERERLPVSALQADLADFQIQHDYDAVVAIGLLMFFPKPQALRMLAEIKQHVRTGGYAIINVLIEGTTYMDMFTPGEYCLFRREELAERFSDWTIEAARYDEFPAPGETLKVFATVITRNPAVSSAHRPQ
ncbi:MAG TPA: class I SAM-dependent methyltransferase [Bryobacterales bacterium]|jgi:tellurite methyltransferase|nr:class I SAM-dependent methyltransferase [Bryobacterales bacterium]